MRIKTERELMATLKDDAAHRRTQSEDTLIESIKYEIRVTMKDIDQILRNKKTKISLSRQKNAMWRLTTALINSTWRYRQFATLAVLSAFVSAWIGLAVIAIQLSISGMLLSRGVVRSVSRIAIKMIIVCMKALRTTLQLPFDIPVALVRIARGDNLSREDVEKMARDAQKDYIKLKKKMNNANFKPTV